MVHLDYIIPAVIDAAAQNVSGFSLSAAFDEYVLRLLGTVLGGPDYSQARLYILAAANVFRNCLIYLLLIQLFYLGRLKSDKYSFRSIRLFLWPLLVYWIVFYSFKYSENNNVLEYDIIFAYSVFLYLSVLFSMRRPRIFPLPTEKSRQTVGYLLAVLSVLAYFFGLPYLLPYVLPSYTPPAMGVIDPQNTLEIANILAYSILVASAEEVFYRGIFFSYLYKYANKVLAFVVAGLIFSLFQFGDLANMAATFIFSLIFSGLLLYSRNVYVPITAHFLIIFMSRTLYGVYPFTF